MPFQEEVDSSLLLMAAKKCMEGEKKIYAVTFDTMLHPSCDLETARKVAGEAGVIHECDLSQRAGTGRNPV